MVLIPTRSGTSAKSIRSVFSSIRRTFISGGVWAARHIMPKGASRPLLKRYVSPCLVGAIRLNFKKSVFFHRVSRFFCVFVDYTQLCSTCQRYAFLSTLPCFNLKKKIRPHLYCSPDLRKY